MLPKSLSKKRLTSQQIAAFRDVVWTHFRYHRRTMPWREDTRPYFVLVSELMLQQTQVMRVMPKFEHFVRLFPDEHALAAAPLSDVLVAWQGLGYNRRAKFLQTAARQVVTRGLFPATIDELTQLAGVGRHTAGAIMNYAFNESVPFVETNIRTALIDHFFPDGDKITEAEFMALATAVWEQDNPREWAWALMDYGTHLKAAGRGRLAQVKQYKPQAPLKGSVREMRGRIMTALSQGICSDARLREQTAADERYEAALRGLQKDGLIQYRQQLWRLTQS